MNLNWVAYYDERDGYGRWNTRFVAALQRQGVQVRKLNIDQWDQCNPDHLTISCHPPYALQAVPGRHWLFTMTEGSRIPPSWTEMIEQSAVERVLVPCEHNRIGFQESGVTKPISIVPGGVDPDEFYLLPLRKYHRPYTFLTLADRGSRKGWEEVWMAFYKAFGGKTEGNQEVRLLIKRRKGMPSPTEFMEKAHNPDSRVVYQEMDAEDMRSVFAKADCVMLPSRSEGWGMPHREAAAMGLPVIVQRYAGLDDGCTEKWGLVVEGGKLQPVPGEMDHYLGEWMVANVDNLAQVMKWVFYSPETAEGFGRKASCWLRQHQTWDHAARRLLEVIDG